MELNSFAIASMAVLACFTVATIIGIVLVIQKKSRNKTFVAG